VAKVYVTLCIVKKDGKSYKKGSVINGLADEEIKRGLAEHWLEAVGNDDDGSDEGPAEKKPGKPPKAEKPGKAGKEKPGKPDHDDPLGKMTADKLISEAVNLGLQADNSMSEEALRKMIREARK
jgi:hypothetical protein